ncbi:MAG: hypothetical protein AAGU05_03325 [Anaerolineaceae bacterium]
MKKVIVFLAAMLLLAACTLQSPSADDTMSTRVAQILTQEYTPPAATDQPVLPEETEPAQTTEPTPQVIVVITPTPTPEPIIETEQPTEAVTEAPTEAPTEEPTPEVTRTSDQDPRLKLGSPDSTDPMDSNELWNWPLGDQEFTSINFEDGFMKLTAKKVEAGWRLPMVPAVTDMYVEMTVRTGKCVDDDNYGIIFHVPVFNRPDQGYLFSVSCDGAYRLTRWDGRAGANGQGWRLVDWTYSDHINAGADEVNRIGVMSKDNRFYLYANGYLLNDDFTLEDKDVPFTTGHFGVFAAARQTKNFTIYIDEISYWDTAYKP